MSLVEIDKATANCYGIDVRDLTISEVHGYYARGMLTPSMLTRCYLKRIYYLNPYLGAVVAINRLATSFAEADTSLPLYGIPILIKDNIAVDNMRTTAGSLFLHDIKPKHEALVVQRLRKQGAIILGKTNLSELSG
ncbi:hypothetical protein DSO57_1006572 [Entomophthora muscae]|uniref:Uncharacterized protein n=1 Tax=Entomophthora muscae TaxID=34485 RepID=A0ACC2TUK6_9FUNG|nr:hypothetical protein DSO57_1006572 [Entomophthora muscae]